MAKVSKIADEFSILIPEFPELKSFCVVGGDVSSLSCRLLEFDSRSESQSEVIEFSVL